MNNENKKNILLVEDEVIIALNEKQQLEKYDYTVHHVTNGEDAIKTTLAPEAHFDLILMDVDLGRGIDGTETADHILKRNDIPVVFLSSHTEPEIVKKTEKITSYGYVVKNSGVVVLDAAIKMALKLFDEKIDRRKAENKLKESEERYRELVDTLNSGVAIYKVINDGIAGSDYIIKDFNQFALKHEMLKKEDVIGKSLKEIRPNIDDYGLIDTFREVWETGRPAYFPAKIYVDNKYSNYYENRVFKLPSGEVVAIYDDVTMRMRAEKSLKESEERFEHAMHATNDGIFDWNIKTNDIYYSPGWKKMLGYENHELPNDFSVWETTTDPKDVKKSWELQQKLITKQIDRFVIEFKMKHKDGHWVDILSRAKAIFDDKGEAIRIVGTHTDISVRKKAEEEIKKQLEEKEILLREVHHRIKNNMNNVESLLSLQADSIDNPEAKTAIQESLARVKSIRVLYDKLLLEKNYHDISIKSYVEGLLDSISAVYVIENVITIKKKITDFNINAKKAISIGIIINELLTNVFKYAFVGDENSTVSILIQKSENIATLTIQDNGIGIDEKNNFNKSPGLGHALVKMLVEQLAGTYSIENDNGTKFFIQFEI